MPDEQPPIPPVEKTPKQCVVCGEDIHERALKSGPCWVSSGAGARTICEHSPDYHHHPDLGPDSGHTFRVSVESRGSYGVVGVEGHTDTDHFDPIPGVVEVRAWNLTDALLRAARRPLSAWFPPEADDPSDASLPDDPAQMSDGSDAWRRPSSRQSDPRHENGARLIAEFEAEHGEITAAEIAALDDE